MDYWLKVSISGFPDENFPLPEDKLKREKYLKYAAKEIKAVPEFNLQRRKSYPSATITHPVERKVKEYEWQIIIKKGIKPSLVKEKIKEIRKKLEKF